MNPCFPVQGSADLAAIRIVAQVSKENSKEKRVKIRIPVRNFPNQGPQ